MPAAHHDGARGSLARVLASWFALITSLLVVITAVSMYASLRAHLIETNHDLVSDDLTTVGEVIHDGVNESLLMHEVIGEHHDDGRMQMFVRVVDATGGEIISTPGFPRFELTGEVSGRGQVVEAEVRTQKDALCYYGKNSVAMKNGEKRCVEALLVNRGDYALLSHVRIMSAIAIGLSVAAAAVAGWWFSRRGMAPLLALGVTVDAIGPRNLDKRVAVSGMPQEVAGLARRFNTMLNRLEEAFARLDRFTGDIAHELRTPVNNIRGMTELMLARHGSVDPYGETFLSILEECQRLSKLIDALLVLARVEDPHARIAVERIELAHELQVVASYYEFVAADRRVQIVSSVMPMAIQGDRILLQRMVGNLVENALSHTPSGGCITITGIAEGTSAMITIADTGEGIPAEQLSVIFERFRRLGAADSKRAGLGLPIVRAVARAHGGDVEMRSELGRGTVVAIRLPIMPVPVQDEADDKSVMLATMDNATMPGMRVVP